jgi:hypothetical protein
MMKKEESRMKFRRSAYLGGFLLAFVVALGLGHPPATAAQARQVPQFKVDPLWPKPLPAPRDANGVPHQWVTGQVGGNCVDSHDHVFALNRAFGQGPGGGTFAPKGSTSIPAPPVIEYDPEGNIVNTWGDPKILPQRSGESYGAIAVLPESFHGCFADYQDNIWIGGYADGVVQKYTHDGKTMLLQIGTKGTCDGPPSLNPKRPYPTCGSPGTNSSHTFLNEPAGIAVDPGPDPATGQVGDVYIADGYGNHRVVVFDSKGKFLRQFGSAGSGDGQFLVSGGGHPHCVILGSDNLVYACDRGQHRIEVFDKMGNFKRHIAVKTPGGGISNIAFSSDKAQSFIYGCEENSKNEAVFVVDRSTGAILGGFGTAGHAPGQFTNAHTMVTDSKGNLYVAETGNGRRIQKFVLQQ